MVLKSLKGALGFLSRLPVGHDAAAWNAFREMPSSMPLAGYVIGLFVALPLILPGPPPTIAVAFVIGVYAVTGINHIDGVIDLGDALVVHGGPTERRRVMKDTTIGAGGALAVAMVILGLAMAGLVLATLPLQAIFLVITAEVGTKLGMAFLVCFGSAPHEGLGSALAGRVGPRSTILVAMSAIPTAVLMWPRVDVAMATLLSAMTVTLGIFGWARTNLGGVSGDVLGATNEVVRIVSLHVGVVAWTHW